MTSTRAAFVAAAIGLSLLSVGAGMALADPSLATLTAQFQPSQVQQGSQTVLSVTVSNPNPPANNIELWVRYRASDLEFVGSPDAGPCAVSTIPRYPNVPPDPSFPQDTSVDCQSTYSGPTKTFMVTLAVPPTASTGTTSVIVGAYGAVHSSQQVALQISPAGAHFSGCPDGHVKRNGTCAANAGSEHLPGAVTAKFEPDPVQQASQTVLSIQAANPSVAPRTAMKFWVDYQASQLQFTSFSEGDKCAITSIPAGTAPPYDTRLGCQSTYSAPNKMVKITFAVRATASTGTTLVTTGAEDPVGGSQKVALQVYPAGARIFGCPDGDLKIGGTCVPNPVDVKSVLTEDIQHRLDQLPPAEQKKILTKLGKAALGDAVGLLVAAIEGIIHNAGYAS